MRFKPHPRCLRALVATGASALAIGVVPAAAQAAMVGFASGTITYSAAKDEVNHVVVEPWGLAVTVTEAGTNRKSGKPLALTAGSGCYALSSSSAACPGTAAKLSADLTDGDDFFDAGLTAMPVSVKGGPGADTLRGGSGIDTLDGGGDSDSFEARDGSPDTLVCGLGTDSGDADPIDTLAPDCEGVRLASPAETVAPVGPVGDPTTSDPLADPTGAGPTGSDPAGRDPGPGSAHPDSGGRDPDATTNTTPATIPPQTVGVSPSGVATVRVDCPADSGGCSGTVRLVLPTGATVKRPGRAKTAASGHRAAGLTLGSAKFEAKPGTSPVVHVRLSKRGRQRIVRSRRGRRARIVVTSRTADGTTSVTTQDVTLRLGRQAARKRRGSRR